MVNGELSGGSEQCLGKGISDCAVCGKIGFGDVVFGSGDHGVS